MSNTMYQVSDRPLHPKTPELLKSFVGNTKLSFKIFVVSITDKCNIKCDFCCHPYQETGISDDESEMLVSQAVKLEFDEICFTGGEPFLRRNALLRAAELCKRHGKLFGVISNGYWAGTRAKADRIVGQLVDAGLTRITISWDPSHGEFVSVTTAQNALDASLERGLKVTLTGSFKNQGEAHEGYGFKLAHLRQYRNFSEYVHTVAQVGYGEGLAGALSTNDSDLARSDMRCPSQDVIELVCYGDKNSMVQPCCSIFAGYKMDNLRIGDWREDSVEQLSILQDGDPYFRIIREGGFRRIYEIIEHENPDLYRRLPAFGDATGVCHFCSKLLSGDIGREVRKTIDDYMTVKLTGLIDILTAGSSPTPGHANGL